MDLFAGERIRRKESICFLLLFFPMLTFGLILLASWHFYGSFPLLDLIFGGSSILLFCLIRGIFPYKYLLYLYDSIIAFALFFTTVVSLYYTYHKKKYELFDLAVICDSGVNELLEFISEPISLLILITGLTVLLVYIVLEYCFYRQYSSFFHLFLYSTAGGKNIFSKYFFPMQNKKWKIFHIFISMIFLLLCPSLLKGSLIGFRFPRQTAKEYIDLLIQKRNYKKEFQTGRKNATALLQQTHILQKKADKGIACILIVGESATSDAMHCYGYPVKTTPFLSRMISCKNRQEKTILMKKCYALDNLTTKVFHQMLSNSDCINLLGINKSILIFDICRHFGIKSYSISNQVADGTSIAELEAAADFSFFPNKRIRNSGLLDKITPPDEIILPEFSNILERLEQDLNNLVILHLFGSHFPYKNRLPENFSASFPKGDLSKKEFEYMKTIEYTDRLLENIFQLVNNKIKTPFVICYVSDHGEDPTGKINRGSRTLQGNTAAFFKVPCIFFFSRDFCKLYPEKVKNLKRNSCKPFINEHIFDALMEIFNISTSNRFITSPEKNIFSPEYKQDLSKVRILDYTYPIKLILEKGSHSGE